MKIVRLAAGLLCDTAMAAGRLAGAATKLPGLKPTLTAAGFVALSLAALLGTPGALADAGDTSVVAVNAAGYGDSIWTPVGIYVNAGDVVVVEADNATWCSGGVYNGGASCGGADGIRPPGNAAERNLPVREALIGTLIGRIGSGPAFAVGGYDMSGNYPFQCCQPSGTELYAFAARSSGWLQLAMNDAVSYRDNSGAIGVGVIDDGPSGTCGPAQPVLQLCSFVPLQLPPPAP